MAIKTAISLPDKLFAEATRFAHSKKLSRSAVIARALDAYMHAQNREHLIADLNRIADENEDEGIQKFARASGRKMLARVEWKE